MKDTINEIKAIELSLQDPDELNQATNFRKTTVNVPDLREKLTSHNFSTIIWAENYRLGEKFRYVTGMLLDFDHSASFSEVHASLIMDGLNHFMITSKSHNIEKNGAISERFHVIIPFSDDVTDPSQFERLYEHFLAKFPEADRNAKGLARHFYKSPEDATYAEYWDGHFFNPNQVLTDSIELKKLKETPEKRKPYSSFSANTIVKTADGQMLKVSDYKELRPLSVHCLWHKDYHPSAFIEFKGTNWFFHCMSCNKSGFSEETVFQMTLKANDNFFYYGKDIYDVGFGQKEFFMTKISERSFRVRLGLTKDQIDIAIDDLVKTKLLRESPFVAYTLNMDIPENRVLYDEKKGFRIELAPSPVTVQDNQLIEDYLNRVFGNNSDFIKKYMALYCFTEFERLPTLLFIGPRSSGKSTLVAMLTSICPFLYADWSGAVEGFTPQFEKRLLVLEENINDSKAFYRGLKKITGQKYLEINKKNIPQYNVRNNLCPVIITNEFAATYMEKSEMPTSEFTNQFFVCEFPDLGTIPDKTYVEHLCEAFPNYAQTVLRDLYKSMSAAGFSGRYMIPVPITDSEKRLFNLHTTAAESEADSVIEIIENGEWNNEKWIEDIYVRQIFEEFIQEDFIPTDLIDTIRKEKRLSSHTNQILKNLKTRRILKDETQRKRVKHGRTYRYRGNIWDRKYSDDSPGTQVILVG